MSHKGLNQLLCAAVINQRFRETLLHNPAQAISAGYLGQSFSLTPEERNMVVDIRVRQLEEFAGQVHAWISGNGSGNGYRVNSLNGKGNNGNGTIGRHGHKHNPPRSAEPFFDLVRAPIPAM